MRERSDIVVLTIVETCEARVGTFIYEERTVEVSAGLFNGQETSRMRFSPLGRCCKVRASLFKCQVASGKLFLQPLRTCETRGSLCKCQERSRKQFSPLWSSVKLVQGCLSGRKHLESCFNHRG